MPSMTLWNDTGSPGSLVTFSQANAIWTLSRSASKLCDASGVFTLRKVRVQRVQALVDPTSS